MQESGSIVTSFHPYMKLRGEMYYSPHFIGGETEAQRSEATGLMSQGQKAIAAALTRATSAFSLRSHLTLSKLIALLLPLLLHRWGKLRLRNDFKPCLSNPDGFITDAPIPLAFVVTCGVYGQTHCDNKKEVLPLEGPGQPWAQCRLWDPSLIWTEG